MAETEKAQKVDLDSVNSSSNNARADFALGAMPPPPPRPNVGPKKHKQQRRNFQDIDVGGDFADEEKNNDRKKKVVLISAVCSICGLLLIGLIVFLILWIPGTKKLPTPSFCVAQIGSNTFVNIDYSPNAKFYYYQIGDAVIKSDKSHLNLSDMITQSGQYTFSVAVEGENSRSKSDFSKKKTLQISANYGKISAHIEQNIFSWSKIDCAEKYVVYCDDNVLAQTQELSLQLTDLPVGMHRLWVVANINGIEQSSTSSSKCEFSVYKKLSKPVCNYDQTTKIVTIFDDENAGDGFWIYINGQARILKVEKLAQDKKEINLNYFLTSFEIENINTVEVVQISSSQYLSDSDKLVLFSTQN